MQNAKKTDYVKGRARHRRTENGDASACTWLAQYLVGRPDGKAPSPLTVVVQQWSGNDPAVDSLSNPIANGIQYRFLHESDEPEHIVRAKIAVELPFGLSMAHCQRMIDQFCQVDFPNDFGKKRRYRWVA